MRKEFRASAGAVAKSTLKMLLMQKSALAKDYETPANWAKQVLCFLCIRHFPKRKCLTHAVPSKKSSTSLQKRPTEHTRHGLDWQIFELKEIAGSTTQRGFL